MDLLEVLVTMTHCMYISDLAQPHVLPLIRRAVLGLQARDYSLREWNDTVEYITRQNKHFDTCEEARAFLLEFRP